MKLSITFKTPDTVDRAVEEALKAKYNSSIQVLDTDDDQGLSEREYVAEWSDDVKEKLAKWIRFGELITVEFDLDSDTATVQRAKK